MAYPKTPALPCQTPCDFCHKTASYRMVAINRMNLKPGQRVAYLLCSWHSYIKRDDYQTTPIEEEPQY